LIVVFNAYNFVPFNTLSGFTKPLPAGREFFLTATKLQTKYESQGGGRTFKNSIQTNGTIIDHKFNPGDTIPVP